MRFASATKCSVEIKPIKSCRTLLLNSACCIFTENGCISIKRPFCGDKTSEFYNLVQSFEDTWETCHEATQFSVFGDERNPDRNLNPPKKGRSFVLKQERGLTSKVTHRNLSTNRDNPDFEFPTALMLLQDPSSHISCRELAKKKSKHTEADKYLSETIPGLLAVFNKAKSKKERMFNSI